MKIINIKWSNYLKYQRIKRIKSLQNYLKNMLPKLTLIYLFKISIFNPIEGTKYFEIVFGND